MLKQGVWGAVAGVLIVTSLPLCAQLATPPLTGDYAAKVVSATGVVNVMRDNQPWALTAGDSIQMMQEVVSGPDGHALFQVSDGSTFEVFPNSHVVFRKNPGSWRDLIDVFVGRVKVHIQHLGNQPNPNRIFTPTAVISVRGTTFDVVVDGDGQSTIVEVEEGVVDVRHALLPGDKSKTLHTGESLTIYKNYPLDARTIDRGTVINHTIRAVVDALQTVATRTPRPVTGVGGGTVGGSAGGTVGDTKRPDPPPPPPPPPGAR